METDLARLIIKLRKYKTLLITGVVLAGVLVCGLIAGGLYLWSAKPWQATTVRLEEVRTDALNFKARESSARTLSLLEQTLLPGATSYIQMQISSGDYAGHANALNCVASLGGPQPDMVIQSVLEKVSDPSVTKSLDLIRSKLESSSGQANSGKGACLSWIMNS